MRLDIVSCSTVGEIKKGLGVVLDEGYAGMLPGDKGARIVLKPNLNANMNALTGNTTDLRLMAGVIEWLKGRGYTNITIAEGTNSGYYRNRISVISRLAVDALGKHYGVAVRDTNYDEPVPIKFEGGIMAGVARTCADADFLINMPKLKTHFEAGMSVCLKNLMGTLVGQENKKKTHQALKANIVNINLALRPHLHIVDAVISMEGLGPTRGTPVRTGTVIVGTDPYLIDLACARLATFDYRKVRTLEEAERRGLLTEEHHDYVDEMSFPRTYEFAPPVAGPIANFIHSPKRQKYFLAIRNTAFFNYVCSTRLAGKVLYATGLRQDVFIDEDMRFERLSLDKSRCTECGRCRGYCPVGLALPGEVDDKRCIGCLYCYCVCPERAIEFHGSLGFMREQLRQYDQIIRRIT